MLVHVVLLLLTSSVGGISGNASCAGRDDRRYSDPNDCSAYVECFKGTVNSSGFCPRCPAGANCGGMDRLVFDEPSQRCVWPSSTCSEKCEPGCLAGSNPRQVLFVWAGAHNPTACNDTVFVLDVTLGSPSFGTIVGMAEAPSGGNEPHHVGLSADGQVLGAGGLLAVLSGQPDLYFFNVSDPLHPTFLTSTDPPQSAIPDEFVTLPDGGFLVTMMGSATGGSPGRVARLNPDFTLQGEYPIDPPIEPPLNPHGIAVDFKRRRMVTGDYLLPASTLKPTNGPVLRTTFRVWDLDSMEIISTYDAGPVEAAGFMDARILGDTGVAILGSGEGIVYGVNITNPAEVKIVHYVSNVTNHCMFAPFAKGTRILAAVFGLDLIQLLDTSNPWSLKVLKEIYLPTGSGPHYIKLSLDERLAVVSTYFLDEDPAKGVVHAGGSRMVYFFDIDEGGNDVVPHPAVPFVDFKAAGFANGNYRCEGWRPHGMAFKQV